MSGSFRLKPLLIALVIPQAAGLAGSLLAGDMSAVYAALDKPSFAPPGWLFGAVWPVLYLLLGIASWLVWRTPENVARTRALTFYAVQLVLNLLPFGASAPCILGTLRAIGSDNCHDRVLFVFAPHSGAFGCPLLRLAGLCRRH